MKICYLTLSLFCTLLYPGTISGLLPELLPTGVKNFLSLIQTGTFGCKNLETANKSLTHSCTTVTKLEELTTMASRLQPHHYVTTVANIKMPKLIYGTAWKKERTEELVTKALRKGFRGIDTACQPKHYNEPGVGAAVKKLIDANEIRREDVFLQTKFTSLDGQDPNRIPYDPQAPLNEQVLQSLETSLKNLQTDYIDSLVMHSPMRTYNDTILVWRVFESFVNAGKVRQLGISNCYDLKTLTRLYDEAVVKPAVIQNRFYRDTGYDKGIRQFAKEHNLYYESFWTLTANPRILALPAVSRMAKKYGKTVEQIFFGYLINSAGMTPLTGTTNEKHMEEDLEALDIHLTSEEAAVFDTIVNSGR